MAQDPLFCAKECMCGASQQVHSQQVLKKMTKLLRDDRSVLREDGAVEFKILAPVVSSQFESSPHWSNPTWLTHLQRGGRYQEEISVLPGSLFSRDYSKPSSNSRPFWRISIDTALQDNVLLPSDFAEYVYHVGSSHDMHSIIQSGLTLGGKYVKKGRQTVFFTTVNPMFAHLHKQRDYDVTKPRTAVYKPNWKIHQNTV